jgi:hypothetical protein
VASGISFRFYNFTTNTFEMAQVSLPKSVYKLEKMGSNEENRQCANCDAIVPVFRAAILESRDEGNPGRVGEARRGESHV